MTGRATVFYDGGCPLCRREIDFYRRQRGADSLDWQNISVSRNDVVAPGLTREEALARFHVRLGDGRLVSGGDAFTAVWRHLPLFRPAGLVLSLPGLRWLLNRAYDGFLKLRPAMQRRLSGGTKSCGIEKRSAS